jgi:hypothetical protein
MGLPGWGTFAGGVGALLGKISTYIPGKVEKLKNEKAALEKERTALIKGKYDEKKGNRVKWIDDRLNVINGLLGNKATD